MASYVVQQSSSGNFIVNSSVLSSPSVNLQSTSLVGPQGLPGPPGDYWIQNQSGIHTLSNVGIGTTNPSTILEVSGDVRIVGVVSIGTETITLDPYGNALYTGIITASSFVGDGSGLTGVIATGSGIKVADNAESVGTASTLNFGQNLNVALTGGVATISVSIPLSALTDVNTSNLTGISTDYLMVYDPSVPGFKFVNPKTYFGINNDSNPAPDIVDYGSY